MNTLHFITGTSYNSNAFAVKIQCATNKQYKREKTSNCLTTVNIFRTANQKWKNKEANGRDNNTNVSTPTFNYLLRTAPV